MSFVLQVLAVALLTAEGAAAAAAAADDPDFCISPEHICSLRDLPSKISDKARMNKTDAACISLTCHHSP